MFQVCFTTYFSEWGKGSREGYSIYYYARAGARASDPCKKNPERWKFLPDGTKNILEGWNSLSDDTKKIRKYSPRKGKMDHPQGKFMLKKADFSFEKIQEKRKKYRNGQKNFSVSPRKKLEKYPDCQERHAWIPDDRNKKKQIFLLKKFRESKKIMETDRKFSQLHIKKAGKIIPTKRKNLRKRMIRMKKAADFS